ncbi:DUF3967 domain-containing protein [Microbacteriaceae bacterium 4G12]
MGGKYKTKDVASKTGIPGNLIRKYSQILEENGYTIDKNTMGQRFFHMKDVKILKMIHERVSQLDQDMTEVITFLIQELNAPPFTPTTPKPSVPDTEDVTTTIQKQNKKFEEFMGKLDILAQLNEAIIHQNSTLISQNRQKDEKLDELMQQVYVKESKQEEMLHDLVNHSQKNEIKQNEKMGSLMNHLYKREAKQEEKINKLINQVSKKEANRDQQLMQLIRDMQETKRMIAASQENTWFKSIKNAFGRMRSEKASSRLE